jgi:hypothetical protein
MDKVTVGPMPFMSVMPTLLVGANVKGKAELHDRRVVDRCLHDAADGLRGDQQGSGIRQRGSRRTGPSA